MVNGDFAGGTSGWTIDAAEEGSVRMAKQEGLGWLQGRYPRTSEGDTGLLVTRNDKGKLRWTSIDGERSRQPARSYGQRWKDFFWRLMPIESQL